jgi:hypothetical protein
VTVAAINPVISHVMLMAERHRLFPWNIDVSEVR